MIQSVVYLGESAYVLHRGQIHSRGRARTLIRDLEDQGSERKQSTSSPYTVHTFSHTHARRIYTAFVHKEKAHHLQPFLAGHGEVLRSLLHGLPQAKTAFLQSAQPLPLPAQGC